MAKIAKKWLSRFARLLAAVVLLEVASLAACLCIQRVEYRKYNKSEKPPDLSLLFRRTGVFYQRQLDKSVYQRDPLLTYRYRRGIHFNNVEFPEQNPDGIIWVSRVTGFVKNNSNPADPEPIQKGEPLIVVTGGSNVAGDDIDRNENTVPSRLQEWLKARCLKEGASGAIRVLNAGVSGYNATQELTYFLTDLSFYKPVAWLQLTGINEAWHLGMNQGSTELHHNKTTRGYPLPDPPASFDFFPATQKLFTQWIPLLFRGSNPLDEPWRVERPEQKMATSERFLGTIAQGTGAAEALGIPHFFFLQPTLAAELEPEKIATRVSDLPGLLNYWKLAGTFYGEARQAIGLRKKTYPRWNDLSRIFAEARQENMYTGLRHYSIEGAAHVAAAMGERIWPELKGKVCLGKLRR